MSHTVEHTSWWERGREGHVECDRVWTVWVECVQVSLGRTVCVTHTKNENSSDNN